MRLHLILTALLLWGPVLSAQNEPPAKFIFAMGGSGDDPKNSSTIFDDAFVNIAQVAKNKGWQTELAFDMFHGESEVRVSKAFGIEPKKLVKFTPETYDSEENKQSMVSKMNQLANRTDIPAGSEVLIWINAHGFEQGKEATHSVACGVGEEQCSLESLRTVIKNLEKRFKVAVVDGSCHSGSSLKLGSDKTCVITAANGEPGVQGFLDDLSGAMRNAKNMDDAYLSAIHGLGSPLISSEAGKRAADLAVLVEDSPDQARQGLRQALGGDPCCFTGEEQSLKTKMTRLTFAVAEAQMKRLIEAHRETDEVSNRAQELVEYLNAKAKTPVAERPCADYDGLYESLYMTYLDTTLGKKESEKQLKQCKRLNHEKTMEDPDFKIYSRKRRELAQLIASKRLGPIVFKSKLGKKVTRFMTEEAAFYKFIYKAFNTQNSHNPCRDFKL